MAEKDIDEILSETIKATAMANQIVDDWKEGRKKDALEALRNDPKMMALAIHILAVDDPHFIEGFTLFLYRNL